MGLKNPAGVGLCVIQKMIDKKYYLKLRNKFIPDNLKIVFLLESPPANGKYFYDPNGSKGELLFRTMMKLIDYEPETKLDGLNEFKKRGYFLFDSTYLQVDKVSDKKQRNLTIIKDIPDLINGLGKLTKHKRVKIIPVKKNICQILSGPLKSVGFNVINYDIPFPDPSQQKTFFRKMKEINVY